MLALPCVALWWIWLLAAALCAWEARGLRKEIDRGEWRRLPCRTAATPGSRSIKVLVAHGPDRWRVIDSVGPRQIRARSLSRCASLDVVHGKGDRVIYRVPEIARLHVGSLDVDLGFDHSREAIAELAEQAGVRVPVGVGGRTPSSEPLLMYHDSQAASTIFAGDGRRVGHVERAGRHTTVLDNDGSIVVRVERRGKRACAVFDGHGAAIAYVSRPFHRATYALVTRAGSPIAALRGRPGSFRIVDGQTDLARRPDRDQPARHGRGRDAERPRDPLCLLLAAAPWIGNVLAEPSD